MYAIFPGAVANVFGIQYSPQIYALILVANLLTSITNLMMTKWLQPATGFLTCFLIGTVITLLCVFIVLPFKEELDVNNLAKWNGIKFWFVDEDEDDCSSKEDKTVVVADVVMKD